MVRFYYYIFIVVLLYGCKGDRKDDCITSRGDEGRVERSVVGFMEVYVEDRIKLVLIQDSTSAGELVISGPKNLLSQITTTVENGVLSIRNNNTCNFVRTFDYEITVILRINELSRLQLESVAEVSTLDTVFIKNLEIEHNALSDINLILGGGEVFVRSRNSSSTILSGRIAKLKGSIEDVSDLRARNLWCDEVLVDSHTPLDCFVYAEKGLFVNIYNKGNIVQRGTPTDYSGVGRQEGTGQLVIE